MERQPLDGARSVDSEVPRRVVGMRRRRYQQGASCEDGFGEVMPSSFGHEGGLLLPRGGGGEHCRGAREGGGKGLKSSRRPALMFLAQAVLSFVGVVVLPTRLAYEVLVVRPPAASGGGVGAAAVSLNLRTGLEGRHGGRRLGDSQGSGIWAGEREREGEREDGEGLRAAGSKGRVLQAAGDDERFTYATRTQFHLCAALPGSVITEGALRAGIVDAFGVEEVQVCALLISLCLPSC